MKKSVKIILFIALSLVISLLAVSCGGGTERVSVSETDSFQSVYVLGQELNLSGGVLKAEGGGKTTDIPLDSDGVSVSGYNKNQLGKQTLTVEYGGVSTEITVTVVERMTVNNFISDYLVGDSLDKTRGNIKITDYDGTSRTVQLSSDEVTVSGFNSEAAMAGLEVKVVYTEGEESIEGSFKVNIYAVESVELRRPNKITYGSHYVGEPDVTGGYLVLKGNGGEIRREVSITADMVSGFDISTVNAENTPVNQTLTVTYDGKPYTYDVQLTYTDISMFLDSKAAFDAVSWDGDAEPIIEKELGELAVSLMTAYIDMPESERALIDADYVFDVARTAMVFGFDVWGENIRLFKGVFAIEYGERVLYLDSYDTVKSALPLFDDEDSAIYTVAPLLLNLIEMYGDRVIYENETTRIYFNSYPVMDRYELTVMEAILEHALDVYDTVKSIPDVKSIGDILDYSSDIEKAIAKIMGKSYVNEYPDIYYLVSEWREGDDLFDIFYSYLYKAEKLTVIPVLTAYGLPSTLHELYEYVRDGVIAMDDLGGFKTQDTTAFFYNYYLALEVVKSVKLDTGSTDYYLYQTVALNKLLGISSAEPITFEVMLDYMRTMSCGYYDNSAGLVGIDTYDAMMSEYALLLKRTAEDASFATTDAYADAVKSIFDKFISLSPTQQYNLISALHSLYSIGTPELAFDDSVADGAYASLFVIVINNLMRSKFTEAHTDTYNNLILAIEIYANRFGLENWESEFVVRMENVAVAIEKMEGTDKENFEYFLSDAYNKYNKIRNSLGTTADLGDWADEFEALHGAIANMQTAYYSLSSSTARNYNYFLASFERASDIAEEIFSYAPEAVVNAYCTELLFEAYPENTETGEAAIYWTFEYAINAYRNLYVDSLAFFSSSAVNVYDTYLANGLDKFLAAYYDMIDAFVHKSEAEGSVFDVESTLAIITAFKNLDSATKAFFMIMEADADMYYSALESFISEALTENAAAVAIKLFALENSYFNYEVAESEMTLNAIKALLPELKSLHDALAGADSESFSPLEEIYLYYVEKCEELIG